jgi:hypothetical protein
MTRAHLRLWLAFAAICAGPCLACDLVTIQYDPGYPAAFPISTEAASVSVSRCSPERRSTELPIDMYFDAVRATLLQGKVESNWGVPAVDAPFVRVTVELSGRTTTLISTVNENGMLLPLDADERDKRHGAARLGSTGK